MNKPLAVRCPTCEAEVIWQESSEFRPFCSARCRNLDFIGWANEEKKLVGDGSYDDLLSGELPDSD